jgi:Tfp pilus assembly protein PilE
MIKLNEYGRSMIEMLGVLAIVGVLSVGGIAGYSKAMTNYKMNKFCQKSI